MLLICDDFSRWKYLPPQKVRHHQCLSGPPKKVYTAHCPAICRKHQGGINNHLSIYQKYLRWHTIHIFLSHIHKTGWSVQAPCEQTWLPPLINNYRGQWTDTKNSPNENIGSVHWYLSGSRSTPDPSNRLWYQHIYNPIYHITLNTPCVNRVYQVPKRLSRDGSYQSIKNKILCIIWRSGTRHTSHGAVDTQYTLLPFGKVEVSVCVGLLLTKKLPRYITPLQCKNIVWSGDSQMIK